MRVPLTLACGDYDRTHPLASGAIGPDGADLVFPALTVPGMARHRKFGLDQGTPFVALLAFVSRESGRAAKLAHDLPPNADVEPIRLDVRGRDT